MKMPRVIVLTRMLCCVLCGIAPAVTAPAAELPSFDDFYNGVTGCSLELGRYRELFPPHEEAVVISLPSARAVGGFLIDSFFFAPGRGGEPEKYGLLFNAPLDAVGQALPDLAGRRAVNGHLRDLVRLSEQSREQSAARKTLLLCTGGTEI